MSLFQSPLSIVFNLALLPVAVLILASFAIREQLAPVRVQVSSRLK